MNSNGWNEYEKMVLKDLGDLSEQIQLLRKDIGKLQVDIAILKVKAGIWGLMGGLIPSVTALAFFMMNK